MYFINIFLKYFISLIIFKFCYFRDVAKMAKTSRNQNRHETDENVMISRPQAQPVISSGPHVTQVLAYILTPPPLWLGVMWFLKNSDTHFAYMIRAKFLQCCEKCNFLNNFYKIISLFIYNNYYLINSL